MEYIKIVFTEISETLLQVEIMNVHPDITNFISEYGEFKLKTGCTFKYGGNFKITSVGDQVIGRIGGLSALTPNGILYFKTKDIKHLQTAKRGIYDAFSSLAYMVRRTSYGPGAYSLPRILVKPTTSQDQVLTMQDLNVYTGSDSRALKEP